MFSATKGGSPSGYQISRSVRLRSSASAYFNRTPASAGNRKTWTWSGWVKRGALGSNFTLFSAGSGSAVDTNWLGFLSSDVLAYSIQDGTYFLSTTQVFRDPSAWYHVILATDTTQATASNRAKIYINGVQVTAFSSATYAVQNLDQLIGAAALTTVGAKYRTAVQDYFDGYLTEVNFIDGQALTPTSFGETNAVTGVWQPKKYAGTYGTNGFYLNFSDNSAATAAAIGKDYSGNGNNWTPNNISVTAGVTYDSMLDVPTQWADGGNGRGNYATLNAASIGADATLSAGNLQIAYGSSGTIGGTMATIGMSSGKWYWETTITASSLAATGAMIGITNTPSASAVLNYPGFNANGWSYHGNNGNKYTNATATAYGATYGVNDVIGVAFDADSRELTFYKNGTSQGVAYTGLAIDTYFPAFGDGGVAATYTAAANFGQRPFAYTPPSGFKALNTLNLPTPTILKGNQYFDATTYTGTGAARSVTNSGAMQPDFIWIKDRSVASAHALANAVTGFNKYLESNSTLAETTDNTSITAVNADGFSLGAGTATYYTNRNGDAFVAWQWKEGATQGFDIVTYTGDGTNNRTVSHSLGVTPSMVIVKSRTSSIRSWFVAHRSLATNNNLLLQSTDIAYGPSAFGSGVVGNLTSSVFECVPGTIAPNNTANINANGENFIAYLFSEVAGFSKFGSYTGNGSADGPFVFCGFRPRYVMIKRTDSTGDWVLIDTARDTFNVTGKFLYANLSSAEASGTFGDLLSNGFKLRLGADPSTNANGGTYIYASFAENPFKNALAR